MEITPTFINDLSRRFPDVLIVLIAVFNSDLIQHGSVFVNSELNRDALSSLELAADANKKPTFCKMLFYFYNKISNLAIVLKLQ